MSIIDKIIGKLTIHHDDPVEKIQEEQYTRGASPAYRNSNPYNDVSAYCTTADPMMMSCSTGAFDYPTPLPASDTPHQPPKTECEYCGNKSGLLDSHGNCVSCGGALT